MNVAKGATPQRLRLMPQLVDLGASLGEPGWRLSIAYLPVSLAILPPKGKSDPGAARIAAGLRVAALPDGPAPASLSSATSPFQAEEKGALRVTPALAHVRARAQDIMS